MQIAECLKLADYLVIGYDGLDMRCPHQLSSRYLKCICEPTADPRITKCQVQ
jgi:hypothetical protein